MEGLRAVGRPASTEDDDTVAASAAPYGYQQSPERLGAGDRRRPTALALVIAAVLALVVWQPWEPDDGAIVPPGSPTPAIARADDSPAPSATATGARAPAPTPAVGPGTVDPAFYVSITDNEWTVVALLRPAAPSSTEEPATQHTAGAAWSPTGPFLVLQQGLMPVEAPLERAADPGAPCIPTGVPRDRTAVPLPAGRVAYLGVTIPGGMPRPTVTAQLLGGEPDALGRATAPAVQLAGMSPGRRYLIPSSGPGGAILFALTPLAPLPSGAYRFEVASPGVVGNSYLYACIAP